MRFKLEKEDIPQTCRNLTRYVTTTQIKANDKTTLSLPTISYVIEEEYISGGTIERFIVIDHSRRTKKTFLGPIDLLKLKLEETDKLALVNTEDQPYYYHDKTDSGILLYNIATTAYSNYVLEKCGYEPPENKKVFIDPKDIISSKNISLILQDLKNSPSKRFDIKIGKNFPWEQVQNALIDYHNVPLEHNN